jgi:hypothetical protein
MAARRSTVELLLTTDGGVLKIIEDGLALGHPEIIGCTTKRWMTENSQPDTYYKVSAKNGGNLSIKDIRNWDSNLFK